MKSISKVNNLNFLPYLSLILFLLVKPVYCESTEIEYLKRFIPVVIFLSQEKNIKDEKITVRSTIDEDGNFKEVKMVISKDFSGDGIFIDHLYGDLNRTKEYALFKDTKDGYFTFVENSGPMDEIKDALHDLMIKKGHCYLLTRAIDSKVLIKCASDRRVEAIKPLAQILYENFPTYPDGRENLENEKRQIYFSTFRSKDGRRFMCLLSLCMMPEVVRGNG